MRSPTMDEEGIGRDYRRRLAENFFYKFFLHVALAVDPGQVAPEHRVGRGAVGTAALHRGRRSTPSIPSSIPLTKPIIKRAAFVQATGEVEYTQDLSLPAGGLHAAMVKSARPHARFAFTGKVRRRWTRSRSCCGSGSPASRRSSPWPTSREGGNNLIGLGEDDPVFSDGVVTSVGAPIGLAVAETIATARAAAAFIEQECIAYEDLPAVLTLDEAIAQDTAMPMIRKASDPDEDVQQRIPALTRPAATSTGSATRAARSPAASWRPARSGPGPRPTSTSRRCAPWPSPARTTR